jgi:hypothetical protein
MTLNFPGSDFGTTPNGEDLKLEKGGLGKGLAILSFSKPS